MEKDWYDLEKDQNRRAVEWQIRTSGLWGVCALFSLQLEEADRSRRVDFSISLFSTLDISCYLVDDRLYIHSNAICRPMAGSFHYKLFVDSTSVKSCSWSDSEGMISRNATLFTQAFHGIS